MKVVMERNGIKAILLTKKLVAFSKDKRDTEFHQTDSSSYFTNLDQKGTIESGLVMIPVTILFLALIQIVTAGNFQIIDKANLHSLIIKGEVSNIEAEGVISESSNLKKDYGGSGYMNAYGEQKMTLEMRYLPGIGNLRIVRSGRSIPRLPLDRFGINSGIEGEDRIWIRNLAIGFD